MRSMLPLLLAAALAAEPAPVSSRGHAGLVVAAATLGGEVVSGAAVGTAWYFLMSRAANDELAQGVGQFALATPAALVGGFLTAAYVPRRVGIKVAAPLATVAAVEAVGFGAFCAVLLTSDDANDAGYVIPATLLAVPVGAGIAAAASRPGAAPKVSLLVSPDASGLQLTGRW